MTSIIIPLEVALARRTLPDFKRDPRSVNDILDVLQYYLGHSRPLFLDAREKKVADIVGDGTLSIEEQRRYILNIIRN
jgi:uridine kinase